MRTIHPLSTLTATSTTLRASPRHGTAEAGVICASRRLQAQVYRIRRPTPSSCTQMRSPSRAKRAQHGAHRRAGAFHVPATAALWPRYGTARSPSTVASEHHATSTRPAAPVDPRAGETPRPCMPLLDQRATPQAIGRPARDTCAENARVPSVRQSPRWSALTQAEVFIIQRCRDVVAKKRRDGAAPRKNARLVGTPSTIVRSSAVASWLAASARRGRVRDRLASSESKGLTSVRFRVRDRSGYPPAARHSPMRPVRGRKSAPGSSAQRRTRLHGRRVRTAPARHPARARRSPCAIRNCHSTRSSPVTASVTGCSTCSACSSP